MTAATTPKKGDIVLLDFNPQSGHEQAGYRPGLVLTSFDFNKATGFCWVAPITSQVKGYPFEVVISGTEQSSGVALVDQVKSLDISARKMKVVDHVSTECLKEAADLAVLIMTAS